MNLLYENDEQSVYPASWYNASAVSLPPFTPLSDDVDCDVCVVGAGYTGLSAALHLARAGHDVVLLDAHRVGWGASGRNGGQLGSGQRVDQVQLESMLGQQHAANLWQLAEKAKACVHELIAEYSIDCEYKSGIVHADHKRRYVRETRDYVAKLKRDYHYDRIEFLDQNALRDIVNSKAYFGGAIDHGSGHLHPLKFAFGLARAADRAGVRIFESSEATNIRYGERVMVRANNAKVTAHHLVLACNGYLGNLVPEVAERVMPINNFIIATEPLSNSVVTSILRDDVAVADSKFVVNYFRMSGDQRLLFGGRESYGYRFPRDIRTFVRRAMLEIYPQLASSRIDYGWGGTLAITMNRMPQLVTLAPNVISASGYSGHGLALATLSGKLSASLIDGEARAFNMLADVPTHRFPGGTMLRSPLLALAMLWYALRDRV